MARSDFDPSGTVRVLGYEYDVRPCPAEEMANEFGSCHSSRTLIRVDQSCAPDHVAQIVLHELMHALDKATAPPDAEMAEADVHRLARGLYALCRDNPAYMRGLLLDD